MEIWKDVIDYEGLYQISSKGNVKSLKRKWVVRDKILSPYNKNTYLEVGLSKGSPRVLTNFRIHRLMGFAFLNLKLNPELTVNHIDGNMFNNNLDNLELLTLSDNVKHAWSVLGSYRKHHYSPSSKLTKIQVEEIRESVGVTRVNLASFYKVSRATIDNVINFKTYAYDS